MLERARIAIQREKERNRQRNERKKRLAKAREERDKRAGNRDRPRSPAQPGQRKEKQRTDRPPSVLAQEEPGGGYSLNIVDPDLLGAVQKFLQHDRGQIINSRSMHLYNGRTLVSKTPEGKLAPIDQLMVRGVRKELEALAPDGTPPRWKIRINLKAGSRRYTLNR